MKKRLLGSILTLAVLLSMTGCFRKPSTPNHAEESNPYYLANEVETLEDLSDDRMVITIDTQYNVSTSNIEKVVETQFPQVNVLLRLHNTADSSYYTQKAMENDLLGDIFFCAVAIAKDAQQHRANFMDLSDAPFINNYYRNALDGVALDGKIYMLPGFSDIYGIVYDRTLFEEHGWTVPASRDEFVALCADIHAEMGYQPFLPTLKYGRMAMMLSHAFHYDSVISGFENQQWVQAYREGKASFIGHMEPLFEGMKSLFDSGVLNEACFTVDPGVRSAMLYKEYTSAMTMEKQVAATYAEQAGSTHEYGMMPFWSGNDPNSDYLISAPGFNIYANKRLEKPENAEKRQMVMQILEYFSTPEGQYALMPEESATISNVKGVDVTSGGALMDNVAATIAKGNIVQEVRYTDLAYNNPFQVAFRESLIGYVNGSMTLNDALTHCDEAMRMLKQAETPKETVYGSSKQNFTVLETAEFVADILREAADADLALVLSKQLSYGEPGNFYEGDITDTSLKMVSLDYVSGKVPEYNRLVTINLTGAQILSIMNYPYLNNTDADTRTMWATAQNPSYWVPSNLKLEYAPLLTENRVIRVTQMDGSAFDLEKTYRVAIWNGCFSNLHEMDYFDAETRAAMAAVTPVSDQTSTDLIRAAVLKAGTIEPPRDGRFTIRWDLKPAQ